MNTKHCLVCRSKHNTLYWHEGENGGDIWCYCNKCNRAYSIYSYCAAANISLTEFLQNDFEFDESTPNEVQCMAWPRPFVAMYDNKAIEGVEYLASRGLDVDDGIFYDTENKGIVLPYYYDRWFCGAQIRFSTPKILEDGKEQKVTTLPGTRLGLLWYNWNSMPFRPSVKCVIVCEGAFNVLSIQQALATLYDIHSNPFRIIACSGSGISAHQMEMLSSLKNEGIKIVCAFDNDEAGIKGFKKMIENDCVTHHAFIKETGTDWNDKLCSIGDKKEFANFFLRSIKKV